MTKTEICESITKLINSFKTPAQDIPAMILAYSSINLPGISPIEIASNIISRQAEAGAPYGPMGDGSRNIAEAMERIRVEEIIKGLMNAKIQIAIPAGEITVMSSGANAGGPVVTTGFNVMPCKGTGIII